jgi:hypothetical protein
MISSASVNGDGLISIDLFLLYRNFILAASWNVACLGLPIARDIKFKEIN